MASSGNIAIPKMRITGAVHKWRERVMRGPGEGWQGVVTLIIRGNVQPAEFSGRGPDVCAQLSRLCRLAVAPDRTCQPSGIACRHERLAKRPPLESPRQMISGLSTE